MRLVIESKETKQNNNISQNWIVLSNHHKKKRRYGALKGVLLRKACQVARQLRFGHLTCNTAFGLLSQSSALNKSTHHHKKKRRYGAFFYGDPSETRTRVTAVRGRCPRPLDDGTI